MLDKKQSQFIFLFKFNMGHKTVETTLNINNACGPGTASKHTVQCSSRSCVKETRGLKRRSVVASHQKLAMTNWQIKADSLTTTEVAVEHSMVVWHLKQNWKRWKSWVSGAPWAAAIKIQCFEVSSLFCATMNHFSIVTCDEKWILGLPQAQW